MAHECARISLLGGLSLSGSVELSAGAPKGLRNCGKIEIKAPMTDYKKLCLMLSSIVTPCQAFIKFLPQAPYNFHTSFSCPCLDRDMFFPGTSFLKPELL